MSESRLWRYSKPVSREDVAKSGSFSILPVRINSRDDIAQECATQAFAHYSPFLHDHSDRKMQPNTSCELGNMGSFIYVECKPKRLGVVTYLTELNIAQDDFTEKIASEMTASANSSTATDLQDTGKALRGPEGDRLMKLGAEALLQVLRIDRAKGQELVESHRKKWLSNPKASKPRAKDFATLEDYLDYRVQDFGMDTYFDWLKFSMGVDPTNEELESISELTWFAKNALVLTNDYYRWEKDCAQAKHERKGDPVNAIAFFMKTRNIPVYVARNMLRQYVTEFEKEYLRSRTAFYKSHPHVKLDLERWIEVIGVTIGSFHYWQTKAPRYRAWDFPGPSAAETKHCDRHPTIRHGHRHTPADSIHSVRFTDDTKQADGNPVIVIDFAGDSTSSLATAESEGWEKPDSRAVLAPSQYMRSMPSKGLRSSLIQALNNWMCVPEKNGCLIQEAVDSLHNASLILDDIEDNSPLRRGKPATHTVFGRGQSINSANYMFVKAVQIIGELPNPAAMQLVLEDLELLHLGQSLELNWKHTLRCPSKAEYLTMVDNKTGGMFRLLMRQLQAESPRCGKVDFQRLAVLLGRYFQIRDDYMNLEAGEHTNQKGFCEDLDEGKFSYPLVCCASLHPGEFDQILGVFRQHADGARSDPLPLPKEVKMHILRSLKKTGSLQATLDRVNELEDELEAEIERLEQVLKEPNPMLQLLVMTLSLK